MNGKERTAAVLACAALAAGIGALAGCSSGSSSNAAAPSAAPTTQQALPGGPFDASIVSCGPQTQADGTPAVVAVVQVDNTSNSVTATPDMAVKFLGAGTSVLGDNENLAGDASPLAPGQSETVDVWALDGSGAPLPTSGTTCQPEQYWAIPPTGMDSQDGPYSW